MLPSFNFSPQSQSLRKAIINQVSLVTAVLLASAAFAQHTYTTKNGSASFFSKAPIADVDARNDKVTFVLNPSTNEISADITMADFVFKSKKMGNDAQKKYIEIGKFPKASFKGKIKGKVDYDKPGTYPTTSVGTLTIHGVSKPVTEKGTVTVLKDNKVKIHSEFHVLLKDYNIDTPSILGKEMTEDRVQVKIDGTLSEQHPATASKRKS